MNIEVEGQINKLVEEIQELRNRITQLERGNLPRLGPRPESVREAANRVIRTKETIQQATREVPPVDRNNICTTSGEDPALVREKQLQQPEGMHDSYIVLCDEERAKGFVRPYRDQYRHTTCGTVTTMGRALSETYARDPKFYGSTFCVACNKHFPVSEFVWTADEQVVGS